MSQSDQISETNEGFSETWLSLREPADHAARSQSLDKQLAAWAEQHSELSVVELGAGTGSNLRYLMPQLGHHQHWHLLDYDANLLSHLPRILAPWAEAQQANINVQDDKLHIEHSNFSATVSTQVINLAEELHQIAMDDVNLITASALLDLTSAVWLDQLATLTIQNNCACLFALNYNGKIHWQPVLEADAKVSVQLNEHQLNDKGFGKALGPEAGHYFAQALETQGRHVSKEISNWVIEPQSQALQHAIVDGWAPAATEQDNNAAAVIEQWRVSRKQAIDEKTSSLTVGHVDVLSMP